MPHAVIIPTLNEKDNIEKLVTEILRISPEFSIVIIDDNSLDGTRDIINRIHI